MYFHYPIVIKETAVVAHWSRLFTNCHDVCALYKDVFRL